MRVLRHSSSEGQLPFFVHRTSSSHSAFRILRFWRSTPRFFRHVFIILLVIVIFGLAYAISVNYNQGNSSVGALEKQPDRSNQMAVPPAAQQFDDTIQNANNPIADFDQVDDAKQRFDEANAVQNNAAPAVAPRQANLLPPSYPRFKGAQNERQRAVVSAFKHAWNGYKKYAWGHDSLKPVSRGYSEWFGTGLTIVDSLDTMIIMGLDDEFEEARRWVSESLTFERSVFVNFFEMSIRMLGGLLSAFHLTNDRLFVEKAADLAGRLVAAYSSQSAIPYSDVNLLSGFTKQPAWGGESSLSEVTSVQLEFRDISRIINNSTYEDLTFATSKHIHNIGCKHYDGLCGMFVSPKTGQFRDEPTITMGARADSYYEYLLKQWLQTGKSIDWLRDDYNKSMSAMERHLVRQSEPNKFTFVGEILPGGSYSPKMDHLACFVAGSLALGAMNGFPESHLQLAKKIGEGCQRMYQTPTGLGPEIIHFNQQPNSKDDIYIKPLDAHCLLRPEAIEAWFYLYRATGDKIYQEWGWKAFEALEKHAKVEYGYSSVVNVKRIPVSYRDMMESFFLSETLKYLYLLLADDQSEIPLDKFVFNTEGHPLPIYDH
uniref:alpha-1,2-Mannosidase n=1 Tax=Ascaris suum TaxID=6253 RepID=F1KXJ2_ASCSU